MVFLAANKDWRTSIANDSVLYRSGIDIADICRYTRYVVVLSCMESVSSTNHTINADYPLLKDSSACLYNDKAKWIDTNGACHGGKIIWDGRYHMKYISSTSFSNSRVTRGRRKVQE